MIGRVMGTPVWAADDDDRVDTFVLSDLHVPEGGGPVVDRLDAVLALARAEPATTRVVILGDLFDSYATSRQLEVGMWQDVVELLRQTTAAGVSVAVLHGNRDFMLDGAFAAATGCRVVPGGLRLALPRSTVALHGDELCQNDRPYQRMKRLLRHPLTRWFLRAMPLSVALWVARRARRRSGKVIAGGDPDRFDPVRGALCEAFALDAELLVFGHIHRPARGELAPGREYCVLPAFDQAGVFLRSGPAGVGYQRCEDGVARAVLDPGPRTFA